MSLTVDNISFGYDNAREILSGVSFQLEKGETLFLLGPNGTGKTTLLKCVNGLLKPKTGGIFMNGLNIADFSPALRAKKIGYVPQYNNNVFSLNVIDTVMMGRIAFAGYKIRGGDKDIVFDVIERLNLNAFAFKKVSEMSGGERQRVFIARALVQEPELIILDEPTSSLDLKNQMFTLELITGLARSKGISILMSIHDLNLTALYADKVMILKESRIYSYGSPKDTLKEEHIQGVYGVKTKVTIEDGFTHVRLKK